MKINRSREIKVSEIPDKSNGIGIKAEKLVDDVIKNYEIIYYDALKTLKLSLGNNISKPLVMYNFIFFVEIALKFYLSKFLSIREFEDKKHNIYQLIEMADKQEDSIDFEELKEILKKFKDKNGKNLRYEHYYDYKYNHERNKQEVIFDYIVTEKDRKRIEEVERWIEENIRS